MANIHRSFRAVRLVPCARHARPIGPVSPASPSNADVGSSATGSGPDHTTYASASRRQPAYWLLDIRDGFRLRAGALSTLGEFPRIRASKTIPARSGCLDSWLHWSTGAVAPAPLVHSCGSIACLFGNVSPGSRVRRSGECRSIASQRGRSKFRGS